MKIGIIGGEGVVGSACKKGFESIGHEVIVHDIALASKIEDIIETEIAYISVPTPISNDGSCDTSIVQSVIDDLMKISYEGVITIKSTVEPGTTKRMIEEYSYEKITFVPEFLKERSAAEDFINHGSLIIGSNDDFSTGIIKESHGNLPDDTFVIDPTEAEITKYFHNVFNALRVIFANEIYEICENEAVNYDNVLAAAIKRNEYSDNYLKVSPELRGYAGVCLPKDTLALAAYCRNRELPLKIFEAIHQQNQRLKKTIFDNMRIE